MVAPRRGLTDGGAGFPPICQPKERVASAAAANARSFGNGRVRVRIAIDSRKVARQSNAALARRWVRPGGELMGQVFLTSV
jgi:hypothetical protein